MNRTTSRIAALGFVLLTLVVPRAQAAGMHDHEMLPCSPGSEFVEEDQGGPDISFCAEWNPEFAFRGNHCCPKTPPRQKGRRNRNRCSPSRANYCDEMTDEQRKYIEAFSQGKVPDVLALIDHEIGKRGEQAYCTVSLGFLAWGRPVLASPKNRIQLRSPNRCLNFGTDGMVGLLEWVGRKIASQYFDPQYSGVHLLIGDIAAPRGGCLAGRGGRRGHASHTSGQDVDVGFLTVKSGRRSPDNFHKDFDVQTNWWMMKQIFQNPYACVKVIFLDRKLIGKLAKKVGNDPDWKKYRGFIHHIKGHKNHMHVRIGSVPGLPGCVNDTISDLDDDEEADSPENQSVSSGQGSDVEQF